MSYYFFVDIFNELTDKITQFVSNVSKLFYIFCTIQFYIYAVNFMAIFRTVAKISQIYRWVF